VNPSGVEPGGKLVSTGRRSRPAVLLLAIALTAAFTASAPAKAESVSGKVILALDGTTIADVSPIVVYLTSADGRNEYEPPGGVPRIRQKDARFSPSFLLVVAGQTVEMPNDDVIIHNVFSFSKGNKFDLGLYPRGESRRVKMRHPGVVRIYCSIHESMNGLIFVSPSPYFATVRPSGSFELEAVPPGKYLVKTWSPVLPEITKQVEVAPGASIAVELNVEAAGDGADANPPDAGDRRAERPGDGKASTRGRP